MYAVVDFEGLQIENGMFIIKELAFRGLENGCLGHWVILPPMEWNLLNKHQRITFSWLVRNTHKMSWDFGNVSYDKLYQIVSHLMKTYDSIFVKDLEKKKFLEKLTGRIVQNLEESQCPKVKNLPHHPFTCLWHPRNFEHFALVKVVVYTDYMKSLYSLRHPHLNLPCQPNNTFSI
ncbi:hypothetical protein AVEN_245958-1 [Araneus ventricosus]|uniref:Uncharacterized protein n=1 Tax=Araneus ventricosus TaxID=182803 RepID=A0A4Y2UI45_ARAVE|nr:hypothetical protein AVEN_245958-1 [Araneus ventricosus]